MFKKIKKSFRCALVAICFLVLTSITFLPNNFFRHLSIILNLTPWYINGGDVNHNWTNFEDYNGETNEYIKIFPEEYPGHDRIREQLMLVSSPSKLFHNLFYISFSLEIYNTLITSCDFCLFL